MKRKKVQKVKPVKGKIVRQMYRGMADDNRPVTARDCPKCRGGITSNARSCSQCGGRGYV